MNSSVTAQAASPGMSGVASKPWAQRLRFEDGLEQRFINKSAPARLRYFYISGWFTLLMFNAFIASDWFMVPDVLGLAVGLRLGISVVLGLMLWFIGRHPAAWLRMPHWQQEVAMMTHSLAFALVMGILLERSRMPTSYFYHGGFALALILGMAAHRLRFRYACTLCVVVVLLQIGCMLTAPNFPPPLRGTMMVLTGSMAFYMLFASHRMEFEERQRFLLGTSEQTLLDQLASTHAQLEELSMTDALTGVANRRGFDRYFEQHWEQAKAEGGDLSLLMLDVDHFKAYNDRYGHPTGDECLRCIALELKRQIPVSLGLVSRWGGEEFIVVLPQQSSAEARQTAQRLRQAVKALGLRHEASPTSSTVTVSVGTATLAPRDVADFPESLIAQADTALYEAKHSGRNCVRSVDDAHRVPA